MPEKAPAHGAPARQYLNTKVTGALLEGMKILAKEQLVKPYPLLHVLWLFCRDGRSS